MDNITPAPARDAVRWAHCSVGSGNARVPQRPAINFRRPAGKLFAETPDTTRETRMLPRNPSAL
jgi:hypothetical protein